MIDIVLCTHNNYSFTAWCLYWLYANTPQEFKLIVMDDSTDSLTLLILEDFQKEYGNIEIVHSDMPYEECNQIINLAMEKVESDVFAYLGNSTIVEPDWLEQGLQFMDSFPDVGIMGFKLLKKTGVIEHAGIAFSEGMEHHMNYGVGDSSHHHTYIRDVGIVGFALVLIRKIAVPEGGFKTGFYNGFSGFDDCDNCLEMQGRGWKVVYNGLGTAIHYELSTRTKSKNLDKYEENRLQFLERWSKLTKGV